MVRKRKPRAYLEKWSLKYKEDKWTSWYARNESGNCIAKANNRKTCEKICRVNGYVPERRRLIEGI